MFKEIIKGKSAFFCDVCGIEIRVENKLHMIIKRWFVDMNVELCRECGKKVREFIDKLKLEQSNENK